MSNARSALSFRCTHCRSTVHGAAPKNRHSGRADRVQLTGRSRFHFRKGRHRSSEHQDAALEYRCMDCDHVGWSAHKDLARYGRRA